MSEQPEEAEAQSEPKFTKKMQVGYRDRGHGHGEYAILNGAGEVVAKLYDNLELGATPLRFRDNSRANMLLFIAAPGLYAACTEALAAFRAIGMGESETARTVAEAMKQAVTVPPPLPREDWRIVVSASSDESEEEMPDGYVDEASTVAAARRLKAGLEKHRQSDKPDDVPIEYKMFVVRPDGSRYILTD